ncbi:MAG TPA: hypothetical protein VKT73_07265 [Xanthobacteraceae bacterium]|nr:hypothetical protein [Xanthobacteraceae bacterium]
MARRRKARKAKAHAMKRKTRKTKKSAKPRRGRRKTAAKSKRKTTISVKSGKASGSLEMRGLRPTGGTVHYGEGDA